MKTGIYCILGGLVLLLLGFWMVSKDKTTSPVKPSGNGEYVEVEEVKAKEEEKEVIQNTTTNEELS